MLAATVSIFLHYAITKGFVVPTHDPVALGWGAFLAIFCTVIPTYMNNEAIHLIGGARMGPFNYVGMGLTFLVSALVLDERFPPCKLAGILLAIVGALALTLGRMGWTWSGRKPSVGAPENANRESSK
jgi:drug/metabolite transporter (DMT)-like permease